MDVVSAPVAERRDALSAETLVAAFLAQLSPETRRLYRYSLEQLRTWMGAPDIPAVAAKLCSLGAGGANLLCLQYVESIRGRQPATKNARLQGVRSLIRMARMLGMVNWSLEVPRTRVQPYRDTRGPGKPAVEQAIRRLQADDSPAGRRNHAILRLIYDLALRRGTVASLDFEHWEPEERCLWVLSKGRTQRQRKDLPEQTQAAIARWAEVRGNQAGALFTRIRAHGHIDYARLSGDGIYRILVDIGIAIEAPRRFRPHGVRHTSITQATRAVKAANLGLEALLAFSDHSSVQTLKHYLDVEEGMQRQVAKLVAAGVC